MGKILYYDSCDEIPIYNFLMLIKEKELKYLIKNLRTYDKGTVEDFIKENESELLITGTELNLEYQQLTFNRSKLLQLKEEANLKYLQSKYDIGTKILDLFAEYKDKEILNVINELDLFNFDTADEVFENLDKVIKRIKTLRNEINIKKINYEKKYVKEYDEDVLDGDLFSNLDKQALTLESNLELNYRVDITEVSVIRWLNLLNLNEEKMKRYGTSESKH